MEIIRPITVEMYRPRAEDRSRQTNLHLAGLMEGFSGRGRVHLHLGMKSGQAFSPDQAAEIDRHVLTAVKQRFHLPDYTDPQEFYLQQQRQAIGVIEYFGHLLPEVTQHLELKDEIGLLSDSPSDLFRLLSMPPDRIDPTLAYEVHRHALNTLNSAATNARTLNGRLRTLLSRVHQQFNAELFQGPEGSGSSLMLESIHDDETNEVVGFPGTTRIPPTAHLKRFPFSVRTIDRIGRVYTSPRKKDDRVSLIKGVAKALNNGGQINLDADVQDPIGMMFVLMEDFATPEQLANLAVSAIKSKFDVNVEVNDQADTGRGQSQKIRFKRRKIWFENVPVPVELMFFDRKNYLNALLEVGDRDLTTGLFRGSAHELFDLRRARTTARVFFPEEIYKIDLDNAFVNRSKLKAQELRGRYRAAT